MYIIINLIINKKIYQDKKFLEYLTIINIICDYFHKYYHSSILIILSILSSSYVLLPEIIHAAITSLWTPIIFPNYYLLSTNINVTPLSSQRSGICNNISNG